MAFHARLADIWAARCVAELPLWVAESHTSDRFTVPVVEDYVLVFESNHTADREAETRTAINWQRVTRVKLLEVRLNG